MYTLLNLPYGRKIRREFNLAILFMRAMMSYVIVTQRIRNPKAPPSLNVRSMCRSGNMEDIIVPAGGGIV